MKRVSFRKKISIICPLLFFLIFSFSLKAQIVIPTQCANSDFSLNNFANWTGCYCLPNSTTCYTATENGTFPNCVAMSPLPSIYCGASGFYTTSTLAQPSLHTIITPQNTNYPNGGYDSLTNFVLKKIPPGVNQVVRLNSWHTLYQSSQLMYQITVDTNISGLFVYNYAAVLENPSHPCNQQPYFQIRILNQSGVPLTNTCACFTYVAGTPGTFVNNCTAYGHIINWFDWQTIGMSLKPYHGQTIKIQFIAQDCGAGGHFGYAYFYALCVPRRINITYCVGSLQATLTAPNGFRYKWYPGGDTTQSIILNNPVDSSLFWCAIVSKSNPACIDTLRTLIVHNIINSDFQLAPACANVPATFTYGSTSNVPLYFWNWNFGNPGSPGNSTNMGSVVSHTFTTPGTYIVRLIDTLASGCRDTMIKTITVLPNLSPPVVNVSICQGGSYTLPNGNIVTTTGVYPVTYTSSNGCDSTVTTNLTVKSSYNLSTNKSICQGQTYHIGTHYYSSSGTYLDSLKTVYNCDSIVTTNLIVYPNVSPVVNKTICQGKTYHVGIHTYTLAGTFIDSLKTSVNCDSIITTHLFVNPVVNLSVNKTICQGQTYQVGIHIYSATGTYIDTLNTYLNCDSIITTHLIVKPTYNPSVNKVICQGQSYHVGTHIYTTAGTYIDSLKSIANCDSIITTHLTVNSTYDINRYNSICIGQTFHIGIHYYSVNGVYNDTLQTTKGCDSIITTHLTVIPQLHNTINPYICQGEVFNIGIHSYTTTGTYVDTLVAFSGCDSVVKTNLTVKPTKYTSLSPVICSGDTVKVGIHNYINTGVYQDTLLSDIGCDSVITTNLLTIPTPTVNLGLDTLLCFGMVLNLDATCQYATYLWQDNSKNSTFYVKKEGVYWVRLMIDSTCTASDTIVVTYKDCSIPDIFIPNAFTPDGDGLNDVFKIETALQFTKFKLYIYNRWGDLVFESEDKNFGWDGTYSHKPAPNAVYVYLVTGTVKYSNVTFKRTGSVTLVR